jgi:hypothetical protein
MTCGLGGSEWGHNSILCALPSAALQVMTSIAMLCFYYSLYVHTNVHLWSECLLSLDQSAGYILAAIELVFTPTTNSLAKRNYIFTLKASPSWHYSCHLNFSFHFGFLVVCATCLCILISVFIQSDCKLFVFLWSRCFYGRAF